MPFYATDNLEAFAFHVFTEWYEEHLTGEDNKEERKEMREMIHNPDERLKEWTEANLEAIIGHPTEDLKIMFMVWLMRSINWDDLRLKLKKWEYDLEDDE